MQATTLSPAHWADLATLFLARLRARLSHGGYDATDDELEPDIDEADALLDDLAGRAPKYAEAAPGTPPALPAGRLLLALRFAATLGDAAGAARLTAARATTILEGPAAREVTGIADLLNAGGLVGAECGSALCIRTGQPVPDRLAIPQTCRVRCRRRGPRPPALVLARGRGTGADAAARRRALAGRADQSRPGEPPAPGAARSGHPHPPAAGAVWRGR